MRGLKNDIIGLTYEILIAASFIGILVVMTVIFVR